MKQALGRGLSALIPNMSKTAVAPIIGPSAAEIAIDKIKPNPLQPRKEFNPTEQQELMDSIREKGILQPILLRQIPDGYEIIAGERRYRAAKALGWAKIPAMVKNTPAAESLELALIENIQRADLNPIEEAKAYERLQKDFHLTQEGIAKAVGKDRSSVANTLRLLSLSEKIQEKILNGKISAGHAKVLLGLSDRGKQEWLCDLIVQEGLSVRQAERVLRQEKDVKTTSIKVRRDQDPHIQLLQEELQRVLGTRIKIVAGVKGGSITIDYYSSEDLERIVHLLGVKQQW